MKVADFLKEEIELESFYEKLFKRLKILDKKLNLFVDLAKDVRSERTGKLKGLPVSAKDCICVKGLQSSAGSKILNGWIPPFDATVVSRIKQENGVIIGKTHQDEFGFGTFCVNSGYAVPKNPWDPERCCGGSSGGAAALTAALDLPHLALAQSTGGSISCPASWCGVFGLTPTYGLVSRWGLIDYANSLDKIGVMAREPEGLEILLKIIAGRDDLDPTTALSHLEPAGKLKRIAVPKEYLEAAEEPVRKAVRDFCQKLESEGIELQEISLKLVKYHLPAYYLIACSEASTNLAKYCGMRYGAEEDISGDFNEYFSEVRSKYFGEEAKRRIILGTFARLAGYRDRYYLKALQVRAEIIKEYKTVFKNFDLILSPTMPCLPPRFSELSALSPLQQYQMDILTVGPNLAGLPHLTMPIGLLKGLPVGIQLTAEHWKELGLIEFAKRFQVELKYPEV